MTERPADVSAESPDPLLAAGGPEAPDAADDQRLAWPLSVAGVAATAYLAINFLVVPNVEGTLSAHVLQPLIWVAVALLALFTWIRKVTDPVGPNAGLLGLAILIGFFQVALAVLLGLTTGFGASPYGHDLGTVLGNMAFVLAPIFAFETVRACVVVTLATRRPTLVVVVTGIFFAAMTVPVATYSSVGGGESLFRFVGEIALPALAASLLASLLVATGGPWPAILYRTVLAGFEWLSPILPDLEWITTAFVGTMGPVIGLIVIRDHLEHVQAGTGDLDADDEADEAAQDAKAPAGRGWMVTSALLVTLVFVANGLLGFQPTPVVGESMSPALTTGDLVITRQVDPGRIAVGDIIRYESGDEFIIHRVEDIWAGGTQPVFLTRGDANNIEDAPVQSDQVTGKVVMVIPKLGWLPIRARNLVARLFG